MVTLGILLGGSLTAGCADREEPTPTAEQLEEKAIAGRQPGPGEILGTVFHMSDIAGRTPSPVSGGVLAIPSAHREELLQAAGQYERRRVRTQDDGWHSISLQIDEEAIEEFGASVAVLRGGVFVLESMREESYFLCWVMGRGGDGSVIVEGNYDLYGCIPDVTFDPPEQWRFTLSMRGLRGSPRQ